MINDKQLVFPIIFLLIVSFILSCGGNEKKQFNIIGKVTSNGVGLSNVTVTVVGFGSQTTDSVGSYAFQNVINGTYTITPTLAGYVFTPTSITVTVYETTVFDQNFTASVDLSSDFIVRYSMDESDASNWKYTDAFPIWGPPSAHLPEYSSAMIPAYYDENKWKKERLMAAIDFWIDQGLNYCHHHVPLWVPPNDALSAEPVNRISNGHYSRTSEDGKTTYKQTCTPARRTDGSQTTTGLQVECISENNPPGCCSAANCLNFDPGLIQWQGVDCSDFSSWIYNFSFGVSAEKIPLQTGIGTQACNGNLKNKQGIYVAGDGVLIDINHKNFDTYKDQLQPGDLLYIMHEGTNSAISHVIVWTGKVWGEIKNDKSYYQEGDSKNFGQAGDRVGANFLETLCSGCSLTDQTPLIVDSHYAGPAYRPFSGWYRTHLSHVRRIINSDSAKKDTILGKLVFPEFKLIPNSNPESYRSVPPDYLTSTLTYTPSIDYDSCIRPTSFNDGSTN